jgi:hypothetical protein
MQATTIAFAQQLDRKPKSEALPLLLLSSLGLAVLAAVPCSAQNRPASPGLPTLPSGAPANSRDDYDIPSSDPAEQQRRIRALNADRYRRVVADSDKLLKMTTELDAEISARPADALTAAQLRKVARIEKLAHELKERLSFTGQPTTGIPLDPRLRP